MQNASKSKLIPVFGENLTLLHVLLETGLVTSNGEARRLVAQGGVSVNEERVSDVNMIVPANDFVLHKGKKVHIKVVRG